MRITPERHRFSCPVCGRESLRSAEDFPFCSDRCRLIDLGRWADGSYRVPGAPADAIADDSGLNGE